MDTKPIDATGLLRELMAVDTEEAKANKLADTQFLRIHEATRLWLASNQDLCGMHELAVEDYVTARHTILSLGLFKTGFALAAQAVEKYLKCHLMARGKPTDEIRKLLHNVPKLLDETHRVSGDNSLIGYSDFCGELEKWYNARYPDGYDQASQWSRSAVLKLDAMVCYLEEHIPMPPTVAHLKFGGGEMGHAWSSIFVRLFDVNFGQHRGALLNENAVLMARLGDFEKQYLECRQAALMASTTQGEFLERDRKIRAVFRRYDGGGEVV